MKPERQRGEGRQSFGRVDQIGYWRTLMGCRNRGKRADWGFNLVRVDRRQYPTAVESAHAMSDDMSFLRRVEITVGQRLIDLIAKLVPTECDPLRRVEDRRNDLKALLTKVFGDAAKILDPELLTKAENAVDKDDIHARDVIRASRFQPAGQWVSHLAMGTKAVEHIRCNTDPRRIRSMLVHGSGRGPPEGAVKIPLSRANSDPE